MNDEVAYIKNTPKDFDSAVEDVILEVEKKQWSLFQVYDIQDRLKSKGFDHPPLKIIEICKAPFAFKLLEKNNLVSLCMPCKINVLEDSDGSVKIVGIKPSMMVDVFENVSFEDVREVEEEINEIIDKAAIRN